MKRKNTIIMILAAVVIISLASCGKNVTPKPETETKKEEKYNPYEYYKYSEAVKVLTIKSSVGNKILMEDAEKNSDEIYKKTLEALSTKEIYLTVPQIDGDNMRLRNREEINIEWKPEGKYGIASAKYMCEVDGKEVDVEISYTSVLGEERIGKETPTKEAVKELTEKATTPESYDSQEYKDVYEKEEELGDGKKYKVIYMEKAKEEKTEVVVHKDGRLIVMESIKDTFNEGFWKRFDIADQKVNLNNPDEYLEIGQTIQEINDIVGQKGKEVGSGVEIWEWKMPNGNIFSVMAKNYISNISYIVSWKSNVQSMK